MTVYNKENKIYTDKVSNQLLNGGSVMTYQGAGIYDNEDFSFIESFNNVPDKIEIGTCWIGDEDTFNEIINNVMEVA